jgi:hypothetical protein
MALWRLSESDILCRLQGSWDNIDTFFLPLNEYHQRMPVDVSHMKTHILDGDDHANSAAPTIGTPADCVDNGWDTDLSGISDCESVGDNNDENLEADIVTDLTMAIHHVSVTDTLPKVQLPPGGDAHQSLSAREQWRHIYPQPSSLPPISSLLDVLETNENRQSLTQLVDPNHCIWTIAASAMAPTVATQVEWIYRNELHPQSIYRNPWN